MLTEQRTFVGRVASYRVVGEGGAGATGRVYRAVDQTTGAAVAIKRLALESEAASLRFRREARALFAIRDDAVVSYVDEGDSPTGPWIAMAWLEGPTLRQHIAQTPIDEAAWRAIASRLARGLAAIHDAGLVHRDLKPANVVLVDGDPARATIVDFGLARREDEAEATVTGASVGTPAYMAPEQARAERGHAQPADLFSLGAVLYECASGSPPFRGQSALAVLAKLLTLRPRPLRPRVPWLSASLDALITRLLSRRAEDRPPSARAVLDALASDARALVSPVAPADLELRPVTILFARVAPIEATSTSDTESDVTADHARDDWLAACAPFGGRGEALPGGAMLALFSSRGSATDSAAMAARAALAIRELSPRARLVLATGTALASDVTEEVTEEAASVALSLLDRTSVPEIAIDDVTRGLLGPTFGVVEVDGSYRLQGRVETPLPVRIVRGREVPVVGRELELASLELGVEQAVAEGAPIALVVLGPAGGGKSTLESAFALRLRGRNGTVVVRARADALLADTPYALLAELLVRRFGLARRADSASLRRALTLALGDIGCSEGDASVLAGLLAPADVGVEPSLARSRLVEAVTRWLDLEGKQGPLVFLIDDLQWTDGPSSTLLDDVLATASGPIVVVGFSRPEPKARFSKAGAREMHLSKLTRRAAEALLRAALGDPDLASPLLRPLVELADGNPLFLEELARLTPDPSAPMVRAEGSVLAMLQARCAGLLPEGRRVLRAASVLGTTFDRDDLVAILDADDGARASDTLTALEREEMVVGASGAEPSMRRFRHALVCEAAYSLLPHDERSSLHGRAYDALLRSARASNSELGLHAARAGRTREAATHLVRGAEEWVAAGDVTRAIALVRETLACNPPPTVVDEAKVIGSIAAFFAGDIPLSFTWGLEGILGAPRASASWTRCVGYLVAVVGHTSPRNRPPALDEALAHLVELEPSKDLRGTVAEAVALATQVVGWVYSDADEPIARALVARLVAFDGASDADALTKAWVAFGLGWGALFADLWHEPVPVLALRARAWFMEAGDGRNAIAADALLGRGLANASASVHTVAAIRRESGEIMSTSAAGPTGTNTNMPEDSEPTLDERTKLGEWLACGAP